MKWAWLVVFARADIPELLAWCEKKGGGLGAGVEVGHVDSGAPRGLFASIFDQESELRGLVAKTALEKGAPVVTMPLLTGLALHVADWQKSALGRSCDVVEDLSNEYLLAAILAVDSTAPHSPWKPYLDTLPLIDVPRIWEKSDAALLPKSLVRRAKNQRIRDRRAYRVLVAECSLNSPRFEALGWGLAIVSSRVRRVRVDRNGQWTYLRMLVPLVDLLNWSSDPNVKCDVENSVVYCTTIRPVDSGEHLTVAYDKTDPVDFLFDYGFVPSAGLDCGPPPRGGEPILKQAHDDLQAEINDLKYKLRHHGHHESRGDLILNVLRFKKACLRAHLPDAAVDDDTGPQATELR
ncbi:hypothetical protein CTAYLR_009477 [Chrysophaeum taylorii]|uniref:SET domain-containing protein n=1 Tax=Chrysophaeum taylorii TaxID=2483200 RepID=A0AAD7UIP5_9STRA|nr:hypothetical protein CTAYLR_009477 [Chrysophaeum taylorii]